MRRVIVGTVVGAFIALAAVTGVSAYWQAQQRIDLSSTSSGDLRIDATWRDGQPTWAPLHPGASTADAVIRVTSRSEGTTLKWRLTVAHSVAPDFQDDVVFAAWHGACGTGVPITAAGVTNLAPDAVVEVCVRFTLATTAPNRLQGLALVPSVTMLADQVSS